MDKKLLIFIIVLFLVVTTVLCIFKPKSHKHIMFENKDFKVSMMTQKAEVSNEKKEYYYEFDSIELPDFTVNIPSVSINPPKVNVKTEPNKTQNKTQNKIQNRTQNKTKVVNSSKPVSQPKSESKKAVQKPKTQQPQSPQQKQQTTKTQPKTKSFNVSEPPIPLQKPTAVKKPEKTQTSTASNNTNKHLTAEQLEIIAWNKWRSDLQNKLMRDSKIAAPIGTTFYFSFTVDKFGTITNLKTWSNNSSYTPLAVRTIKPLLLSYQKTPILNFPANSKRIITNVEGSFTMATSSRYSSPSDYNDYERVSK